MNAIETSIEPSWDGPLWWTLAGLAACAAFVWSIYRREPGPAPPIVRALLATVRFALFVILAWMFYGWLRAEHRMELPELAVVVDVSASMATVDRDLDGGRSDSGPVSSNAANSAARSSSLRANAGKDVSPNNARLERVKRLLATPTTGLLERWRQRYRVRFYRVGATTIEDDDGRSNASMGNPSETLATGDPARELRSGGPTDSFQIGDRVADWRATDDASRLGDGLFDVLQAQRGRPTASVLLFSDGVTTAGRSLAEAATLAGRRRVPLHCVGVGGERPPQDVRLSDLAADDSAFVGDLVVFQASLSAAGYTGQKVKVRLVRQESGAVLGEQVVVVPPEGKTAAVRIAFRPLGPGDFSLALVADTLAGEATEINNRLARTVRVGEETLRVLLVQADPSYEFRYLRTLLQRQRKRSRETERAVELTFVLQAADAEYASIDPDAATAFPATRDELFRYDVVILGDADPSLIGPAGMANLEAFVVERGGGLIVCAGPLFMPQTFLGTRLASLLPFELESVRAPALDAALEIGFQPRLAPLGAAAAPLQLEDSPERNLRAWSQLPSWYWFAAAPELRPGARVLVEHPSRSGTNGQPLPLLVSQFVGAGQVVAQLGDDSWRWSRVPETEPLYVRYWMQLLRWLSRSRLAGGRGAVQITTDRESYETTDSVRVRVRFVDSRLAPSADDGVVALVQRADGPATTLVLRRDSQERGSFRGTLPPLAAGDYRVWLVRPSLPGTSGEASTGQSRKIGVATEDELASDKPAGDKSGGDKSGGDKLSGDLLSGVKQTGDKQAGDKVNGDKLNGDKLNGDLVRPDAPATRFAVVARSGEQARLELDVATLKEAARISGGKYYPWSQAERLADELPAGRPVRIDSSPAEPVWNRWPVAALFVALITAEWLARKRWSMA